MILRIFDCKSGHLVSLLELLKVLMERFPGSGTQRWSVERIVANNGIDACSLEENFDAGRTADVSLQELTESLNRGADFTSLRLRNPLSTDAFGMEDSTYLFIESENQVLINEIAQKFRKTQLVR